MLRRYSIMFAALTSTLCCAVHAQTPAATPPTSSTAVAPVSRSLGVIVYPAKQQTANQQSADEQECYNWSMNQTGIDPQKPAPTVAATEESGPKGTRVKSAARGAAAGAIIGEVADNDADQGAKVGATAGVLAGGHRAREDKRAQKDQAAANQQAAEQERQATFRKAFSTCLSGKGYTTG
jgi:hypothetical protein